MAAIVLRLRCGAHGLVGERLLQVELEVLDVREPDLFQASGAAAAILEVDLLEGFGRDLLEAGVAGALLLGVKEAGGVDRRQGDGQVPDAVKGSQRIKVLLPVMRLVVVVGASATRFAVNSL
ncbi:hypothetical protein GCM10010398_68450 [Streptomyces fimbriatus]